MNHHPAVDEAAEDLVEAVKDLTQQLEETASETGAVTALMDSITRARNSVRIIPILLIQSIIQYYGT